MMTTEMRKSGIDVVGDMPWGTHICLFYETKRDPGLRSIIVPGSTNVQPIGDIPPYVLRLITPYRDCKIHVLEG